MGTNPGSDLVAIPDERPTRIGNHALLAFDGCRPETINRHDGILTMMYDLAREMGVTVLGQLWHDFEPQGSTCLLLLAESHIAAHSWPEDELLVVDVFSCGPGLEAEKAAEVVMRHTLARDWRCAAETVLERSRS